MLRIKRLKGAGTTLVAVVIMSGIAVSTLGQRQYTRMTTDEVWAAGRELPAGHTVQAADLQTVRMNSTQAAMALTDPAGIIGRRLVSDKKPGDVINRGDVSAPQRLGMTDVIPADRVVYTLTPDSQLLPYTRQLRNGDSFDILATAAGGRVVTLANDVILLGNLQDEPQANAGDTSASLAATIAAANPGAGKKNNGVLVLAVKPEHVYPLASTLGSSARISLVAHGRTNISNGNRLPVQAPPVRERRVEIISGQEKAYVTVRQNAGGQ
jgi:hypothetical protein